MATRQFKRDLIKRIGELTGIEANSVLDLRRAFPRLRTLRLEVRDLADLVQDLSDNPDLPKDWLTEVKLGRPSGSNSERDRKIVESHFVDQVPVNVLAAQWFLTPTRIRQILDARDRRIKLCRSIVPSA